MSVVALLSDFGCEDHYVAVTKARVLHFCPQARLIDITHMIPPQDIDRAGFELEQSVEYFPPGTVFLCVVDPGVGTTRKAVAVKAGEFFFVTPDNGLLTRTLEHLGESPQAVELAVPIGSSTTFHGRDVFAPAAGRLAAGEPLESLGTPLADLQTRPRGTTIFREHEMEVTVLAVDRFGNIIFDFHRDTEWEPLGPGATFRVDGRDVPFCVTYSRVLVGDSLLLWNSSNYLELAVRDGHAAQAFRLSKGKRVTISKKD